MLPPKHGNKEVHTTLFSIVLKGLQIRKENKTVSPAEDMIACSDKPYGIYRKIPRISK